MQFNKNIILKLLPAETKFIQLNLRSIQQPLNGHQIMHPHPVWRYI